MNNERDSNTEKHLVFHGPPDTVLLNAEEVAQILRVPKSWIYSHLDRLPTVRLGRYVRFRRTDIENFLAGQTTSTCQ